MGLRAHRIFGDGFKCGILFFFCGACSSKLKITTQPEGAFIVSEADEQIGQTPFDLGSAEKNKLKSESGFLKFHLKKEGFDTLSAAVDPFGSDEINFVLKEVTEENFQKTTLKDYAKEFNSLSSELLLSQGLIVAGRFQAAEEKLKTLQKKFPFVASIFALEADLRIRQKKPDEAAVALKQAYKLAPYDTSIIAGLKRLGVKL